MNIITEKLQTKNIDLAHGVFAENDRRMLKRLNGKLTGRKGSQIHAKAWRSINESEKRKKRAKRAKKAAACFPLGSTKNEQKNTNPNKLKIFTDVELARLAAFPASLDRALSTNIVIETISTNLPNGMTVWERQPTAIKDAWRVAAVKSECLTRPFCAYTLHYDDQFNRLSKCIIYEDEKRQKLTPASRVYLNNLKDEFSDNARGLLNGKKYLFGLELTKDNNPHIHLIIFDTTEKEMNGIAPDLRLIVGEWQGNAKQYQDNTKQRTSYDDALGWVYYSLADDLVSGYAPRQITQAAERLYKQTQDRVNPILDNIRRKRQAESKVLEEIDHMQSDPENIRHQNLKSASEPAGLTDSKNLPEYGIWS